MPPVPQPQPFAFPKSSTPGSRAGEGEGRLLNCYLSKEGDRAYLRRSPGLATYWGLAPSSAVCRGMIIVNSIFYIVRGTSVFRTDGVAAAVTLTGTIPGTDGVTLARNNRTTAGASTPDIVAVRESGGAYTLSTTAVAAYPDVDLPTTVNSVDFLGGYFLFSNPDGRFFASDLNTTAINALSFTTAENRADPLRRIIVSGNIVYAMGGSTIEPYTNVGTTPFPLQRAATVPPIGVLSTMTAVGNEEGWNNPIFFVGSDKTVKVLSGYETNTVSTPDVDRFISASTTSTIDMLVYVWNGHPFVVISSNVGTWAMDVVSKDWHERLSQTTTRWRAIRSGYAYDIWWFNDTLSGALFVMTAALTEAGAARTIDFAQSGPMKGFPVRISSRLAVDMTEAEGGSIALSWSHDGGKTFGTELTRSLAEADHVPVRVSSLGKSTQHGIIIKVRWLDAVDSSISGAAAVALGPGAP
jgi:hypothetical protein